MKQESSGIFKDSEQDHFMREILPKSALPKEVRGILALLKERDFQAFIVGGCLRDILLGKTPKDWDVATNAKPAQLQEIFPDSFYENQFYTVGIKTGSENPELSVVEATTFRKEGKYTDKRHPDKIEPAETVEEDLSRRDFTINAIAFDGEKFVDPFDGRGDLDKKLIRAVGDPNERFEEDALRLMRAARFSADLGFEIEKETGKALRSEAGLLEFIAKERIADEFKKMMLSKEAARGIELLREYGLLRYVLPELLEGYGVTQNKHHIYTVWEHSLRALDYACKQDYPLSVRIAALLHDVGKPKTKTGEGPDSHFYGHEVVGTRMAIKALERLRLPKKEIEQIALLIKNHMFASDPDQLTDAGIRRIVTRVGPENVEDLIRVRISDRIGSGTPKAMPRRLLEIYERIQLLSREQVSRKSMAVNGDILIEELSFQPGPRLGAILEALFEEVLDDPARNSKQYLLGRAKELNDLDDEALVLMRRKAQEKYHEVLLEEEKNVRLKARVEAGRLKGRSR